MITILVEHRKDDKMLSAIIENNGNTLIIDFSCKPYLMAEHLASIKYKKPKH